MDDLEPDKVEEPDKDKEPDTPSVSPAAPSAAGPVPSPTLQAPPAVPPAPQVFPSSPQGQISEEQWKMFEKQTDLSRTQILAVWSISQASLTNSPHTRVLEKEILSEAKAKLPKEFYQFDNEVKEEMSKLNQPERSNVERIEELYYKVAGKNLAKKKVSLQNPPGVQRRIVSGVETRGDNEPETSVQDQIPSNLSDDEKEIYKRYGFKNKKEFDHHNTKEISLESEENWKPIFK